MRESRNRWGKRKPGIVSGAACATIFQLALAYSLNLKRWTVNASSDDTNSTAQWLTQAIAVFCVIIITFALQAYAVDVRALIVDNCPLSQQYTAAAWAMRWYVLGNLLLSSVGFVDAQWSLFGDDINARFKTLTLVAAACSLATVGLTCFFIPDKNNTVVHSRWPSLWPLCRFIVSPRRLIESRIELPPINGRVCTIQLFAWAGWFPVLYYMSTYVYEVAFLDSVEREGLELGEAGSILVEDARKYSFFASFAFALGSFVANVSIRILERATLGSLKLRRMWFASQCFLGCCLHLTFVSQTGVTAIIIVAMMGLTGPVTVWVPFALISAEISELSVGKPDGEAGWIMGLHNVAISLPQIGSTLACTIVLATLKITQCRR